MAKNAPVQAAAKKSGPSRHKRNALERKCLSKESKRMFMNGDRSVFKMVLAAERAARVKNTVSLAAV